MSQSRQEGDLHVNGTLTAKVMSPPDATITNAMVSTTADIASTKLEHQHAINYSQANVAAADETRHIHEVYGASATLLDIRAGSIVAAIGDSTVTIDLKKNGASVLSAVITLDSTNTAYTAEAGTISSAALTNGDSLTLVVDATIGTGTLPTGLFVHVRLKEKAA